MGQNAGDSIPAIPSGQSSIEIMQTALHKQNSALLHRACQGDSDAYGQLFMNFYVALVRFAWPMLGQQEDAEDAVHDAFINSWTRLHRFDASKGQFSTWIFAITRNCCLTRLRKRQRYCSAQGPENFEFEARQDTNSPDPASAALDRDRHEEVMRLLSGLSEKHREAIVLYYWSELSVKEIADVTATSESNVKSRLSRGRKHLAEEYGRLRAGLADEASGGHGWLEEISQTAALS